MAALVGSGTLMSIRERLTPKVAAAIAAVFFGSAALADALSMVPRVGNVALIMFKALAGGMSAIFVIINVISIPARLTCQRGGYYYISCDFYAEEHRHARSDLIPGFGTWN